jgi:hypothetical protein
MQLTIEITCPRCRSANISRNGEKSNEITSAKTAVCRRPLIKAAAHFYSAGEALAIVILGSMCGLRNTSQTSMGMSSRLRCLTVIFGLKKYGYEARLQFNAPV